MLGVKGRPCGGVILSSELDMKARPKPREAVPDPSEQRPLPGKLQPGVRCEMTNGPSATSTETQAHCWFLAEAQSHSIGSIHYRGTAEDENRMILGTVLARSGDSISG